MRKSLAVLGMVLLLATCRSAPPQSETPVPPAPEPAPEVIDPTITITSITILQADLINTEFKLSLRIDNPNAFPITLASFRYELYGDGRFWAGGVEKDLGFVPARDYRDASFKFEMNFIGMKRRLLDDIIAMREVRYRIAGSMELGTDVPSLPAFRLDFDHSGNSAVIQ